MAEANQELFQEVISKDFLSFSFNGRGYQDQLNDAITKTNLMCAISVTQRSFPTSQGGSNVNVIYVAHNFSFLGGSLGCAECEKITRGIEIATQQGLAVVIDCKTGGARMQEGVLSLMQMAKVSVAVAAHAEAKLPFIALLNDPTYGGVSASYAMQADVKIAIQDARIGFAGPQVILNTMFESNQDKFDQQW